MVNLLTVQEKCFKRVLISYSRSWPIKRISGDVSIHCIISLKTFEIWSVSNEKRYISYSKRFVNKIHTRVTFGVATWNRAKPLVIGWLSVSRATFSPWKYFSISNCIPFLQRQFYFWCHISRFHLLLRWKIHFSRTQIRNVLNQRNSCSLLLQEELTNEFCWNIRKYQNSHFFGYLASFFSWSLIAPGVDSMS